MVGHGGSSAGSYLADTTSPITSHCAPIVVTSTLRANTTCTCSSPDTFVAWQFSGSHFLFDFQDQIHQKIQWMMGSVSKDFHEGVTHLIAGEVGSKKYIVSISLLCVCCRLIASNLYCPLGLLMFPQKLAFFPA